MSDFTDLENRLERLVGRSRRPIIVVAASPSRIVQYTTPDQADGQKFRLASLSKHFTAATTCAVYDRLGHDLSAPIVDLLGSDAPFEISMLDLLTQNSGIRVDYMPLADECTIGQPLTLSRVLSVYSRSIARGSPRNPVTSTGSFSYNNTNYVLAAAVIEKLSDSPFDRIASVFGTATGSDFVVGNLVSKDRNDPDLRLLPDTTWFGMEIGPTAVDGVAGDGAVFASAQDIANWMSFWRRASGDTDLRDRLVEKMSGDYPYLFGYIRERDGTFWHNGSWLGARGMTIRTPDYQHWLYVVTNGQKNCERLTANLWKELRSAS